MLSPILNSRDIHIYNSITNSYHKKTVEFNTLVLNGLYHFPNDCAYTNINGKLYICGGLDLSRNDLNTLVVYDSVTNQLTRLADMLVARSKHSIIGNSEHLYVVGGKDQNSCERFDIKTGKWIKLNNVQGQDLITPTLSLRKNNLYAFFGIKTDNHLQRIDTVQKLNTKNMKSKWEIVTYKNPDSIHLKLTKCGVLNVSEDQIYLFGGETDTSVINSVISFDFNSSTFTTTSIILEEGATFNDSNLIKLDDNNNYGQFNSFTNSIFKIKIE